MTLHLLRGSSESMPFHGRTTTRLSPRGLQADLPLLYVVLMASRGGDRAVRLDGMKYSVRQVGDVDD
jgi:hypothetical protein